MRKRSKLSVILVLSFFIMSVLPLNAFAATFNDAAKVPAWAVAAVNELAAAGVLAGDENGNFNPLNNVTRAEAAKVIVAAKGLTLVNPATASFSDVEKGKWFYTYVETAKAAGIVEGNAGKFNPNAKVTRQELAKMFVAAEGTAVDANATLTYSDAAAVANWAVPYVAAAKELGLMVGANNKFNPTANAIRAELAQIGSNFLGLATAELAVVSVSAINGKQIQVVFTRAIDEDTVIAGDDTLVDGVVELTRIPAGTDADKRVVADTAWAKLSSDGKILTITASGAEYFEGSYGIAVDDTVRDEKGQYLTAYSNTFTASEDNVAPAVKDITFNPATNQFAVKMSEPVSVQPTITIDGGAPATIADVNNAGDEFKVENTAELGSTVTILVSGAIDYNDNSQDTYSKSVKVNYEESKLTVVSVKQESSNKIEVVFDKSVAKSGSEAAAISQIEANVTALRGGASQPFTASFDSDDKTNTTVFLTFAGAGPDYPIYPDGKDSVTLSLVFAEEGITDIYGNTNDEITKSVTMIKDKVGPIVTSVRLSADKKAIEVRFNEDVNEISVNNIQKLTVRDGGVIVSAAAGTEGFRASAATINEKLVTIPYQTAGNLAAEIPNGSYTVRIDKDLIEDDHGNNNLAITTAILTVAGSDAAGDVTVTNILDRNTDSVNITSANKYRVVFSDEVGSSALTPTSYTLNGVALPSNTDIAFEDSSKTSVVITLQSGTVNYDAVGAPLRVLNVKDTNGNKVVTHSVNVEVDDNVKPALSAARLTGNTLTLTFSENMASVSPTGLDAILADLEIKGNSVLLQDLNLVNADIITTVDAKTITFTFTNTNASDNNWSIVKAASNITVKVADDTLFTDANGTVVKTDVTVTVVKN